MTKIDVHKGQRRAISGISEVHSGHSFVGGTGFSSGNALSLRKTCVSGFTTKKNITVQMTRNEMSAFKKAP